MKICTKCEVDYQFPIEDHFNRRSDTKDGFQRTCKVCVAEWHKEHYKKRTSYYKKKALKHNAEYRIRNLQYITDYLKGHPCVDCGEVDPIVLEFDHRSDKQYNISEMHTQSLDKIKEEIAKCDVRCANCHRRKTAVQFNYYKDIQL